VGAVVGLGVVAGALLATGAGVAASVDFGAGVGLVAVVGVGAAAKELVVASVPTATFSAPLSRPWVGSATPHTMPKAPKTPGH